MYKIEIIIAVIISTLCIMTIRHIVKIFHSGKIKTIDIRFNLFKGLEVSVSFYNNKK